jgi:hypothetical protein
VVTSVINAPYTWLSTSGLINDVQGWLNTPASNFGWEVINLDEITPTDFRAFYTREFSDAALRPQLQVTFTPPVTVPEPTTMMLLPVGLLGLALGLQHAGAHTTAEVRSQGLSRGFNTAGRELHRLDFIWQQSVPISPQADGEGPVALRQLGGCHQR